MSPRDVRTFVEAGGRVAVDTNVVWARNGKVNRDFAPKLIDAVKAWNHAHGEAQIEVIVPSLVLAERVAQMRRQLAQEFNPKAVKDFFNPDLAGLLSVAPFRMGEAIATAEVLARWYPSDDLWQDAKIARLRAAFKECGDPHEHGPATTDWLLAGWSEARGWLLVTHDSGVEFDKVTRKTSLKTLFQALSM